jgi:hypothetical protein
MRCARRPDRRFHLRLSLLPDARYMQVVSEKGQGMTDEVLATVKASTGRRWVGVAMLGLCGFLLIYIAFARPPALAWQLFLLVTGGAMLWLGEKMRRASERVLELTETELRDSTGLVLARVEDIISVDRGFFAFKPSHGFLLKTKNPGTRVWLPGLWWRIGRRVGVGGVTPGRETRNMSEILAAMLAVRNS